MDDGANLIISDKRQVILDSVVENLKDRLDDAKFEIRRDQIKEMVSNPAGSRQEA